MLSLRTFGTVSLEGIEGDDVASVLSQPKRLALLIYLAAAQPGQLHRRDTLLALFWPERDEQHARNALSQSLSYLRRHLPDDALVSRGFDEVGIAPGSVAIDVVEFDSALREERWEAALSHYQGDFLHGFHVGSAGGFEEWMELERERLKGAAAKAAWSLAHQQIRTGALVDAERTARRALGLICTDESPVREFIKALAGAGDRAAALSFYSRFCDGLMEQLELEPSPQTLRLVETIRSGELDHAGSGERSVGAETVGMGDPMGDRRPTVSGTAEPPLEGQPGPGEAGASARESTGPWRLRFWALFSAAAACFILVALLRFQRGLQATGPPPEDRPYTMLAQVDGTADPEVREAVALLLRAGLDMARVIRAVPEREVHHALELMDRSPNEELDVGTAREIAVRLGVATVVVPRLDNLGGRHVLAVRVEDVESGSLRAQGRGVAENESELVETVDEVVRAMRRHLGEARGSLASTQPLPELLTPSLEALLRYRRGLDEYLAGNPRGAVVSLREAVTLDSAFAHAWLTLSQAYTYLGKGDSASLADQQVWRYLDRLGDARRADRILSRDMEEDIANWDGALEMAERSARRNPDFLANYPLFIAGYGARPDSALNLQFQWLTRSAEEARRFEDTRAIPAACWINTVRWAVATDRVGEWMARLDSLGMEIPDDCLREARLFDRLAAADWDEADSLLKDGMDSFRWLEDFPGPVRQLDAARGRVRRAYLGLNQGGMDPGSVYEPSVLGRAAGLLLRVAFGLSTPDDANRSLGPTGGPKELGGRGPGQVTPFLLHGVQEGLVGDTVEAKRVMRRLTSLRDSATSETFEASFQPWLALLETGPAYRRGDWDTVIRNLQPVALRAHEPGVGYPGGGMYMVRWILAEAREQSGDLAAAARTLEAILERPRHRAQDWILLGFIRPAVRFRLAGLYGEMGDVDQARDSYQAFVATFTDPDPEVKWMVDEAMRRLAEGGP